MKDNILKSNSRALRNNQTEAEKKIWYFLRLRNLNNRKFRRQFVLGKYIVDFICFENKLIIEIDGGQHAENKIKDQIRDEWLKSQNFTLLRFWNNEVLENTEAVIEKIRSYC